MKAFNVYLSFSGNCREAMAFYETALGGQITGVQTWGDSPVECAEGQKDKVMHAELKAEGITLMGCDVGPEHTLVAGNNVTLSIQLDNADEQTAIFNRLADGGQVVMALEDAFWGARFGMLVDKYGFHWMLNCEKKQ